MCEQFGLTNGCLFSLEESDYIDEYEDENEEDENEED
jgi:hypothetical protein